MIVMTRQLGLWFSDGIEDFTYVRGVIVTKYLRMCAYQMQRHQYRTCIYIYKGKIRYRLKSQNHSFEDKIYCICSQNPLQYPPQVRFRSEPSE
jgi:hypothetical protein